MTLPVYSRTSPTAVKTTAGRPGDPWGVAARGHLPLEHRTAGSIGFRRRSLGNELERPGQRDSHKPDPDLPQPYWNASPCGYRCAKTLRRQRLRYQGDLPEFPQRLSWRNWPTELHPPAGIHKRGPWVSEDLRHALEREAPPTAPLGRVQRRQSSEFWLD